LGKLTGRNVWRKGKIVKPSFYPRQKNPTFPELAGHFLGLAALKPFPEYGYGPNVELWEKRAPIGKIVHDRLLKTKCDKELLADAYGRWIEIAKHSASKPQLNQLLENARDWMEERNRYREYEKGFDGSEEEQDQFWQTWIAKGVNEIKKTKGKGKKWEGFLRAKCYQHHKWGLLMPFLDYCHPSQIDDPHCNVDALLGCRDGSDGSDSSDGEDSMEFGSDFPDAEYIND